MKRTLLFILATITCTTILNAKILRVNNEQGNSAQYKSFADALTASENGDTIYLEGSSQSYTAVEINKEITVIGPGYKQINNNITNYGLLPAKFDSQLKIKANNVVLKGLTLTGLRINMGENIVISRNIIDSEASYSNTSILVYCTTSNNIIHQNIILEGIEVSSNGSKGASGFVITNNIIENSIIGVTSSRIEYNTIKGTIRNPFDKISGCDIKNNIFYATEDFAIFKDLNINNSFSYNSYNSKIYFTNPDVNFSDVNFENLCKPEDGSFPTSASSEGKEVGAFGGTDPYVLSGIPNIPLIKFIDVPANANSENGLPVNVIISTQR